MKRLWKAFREMLKRRRERDKDQVVIHAYPKLIFVWPLIVAGYVLGFVSEHGWVNPETLAWVWGIALIISVLAISVDVNRNTMVFWFVLISAIWILILWLRDVKGFTVFGKLYRFFADLDPQHSAPLGVIVSIILTIPFILMIAWARVNDRWRLTHNEIEHYSLGRQDDALGRGAKRIVARYNDFLEVFLLLGGNLIVYDAQGMKELRVIHNVPLLPFRMKRINRIIESTAVTAAAEEDAAGATGQDETSV